MADDSALVFVAPSDSVESIARKIRATGSKSIELLVPDETLALQALRGFERLRQLIERDQVSLLVISSDEKTLGAAQLNQIDTVGVQGVRVMPPAPGAGDHATARPHASRATVPLGDDAEFLDALDQMAIENPYAGEADADLFATLDDLSSAAQAGTAADRRADDELAAALSDWTAVDSAPPAAEDWDAGPRVPPAPRRRVRPEDVRVEEDELRRQRGARRARAAATPVFGRADDEDLAPRRAAPGLALPLLILLLIVAGAVFWYARSRATIAVAAPAASASHESFAGEVIPLAGGADKSQGAVQATSISAAAEFQIQGQVISETLSPVGTAKGVVTLINRIEQPIPIPEGTQFIAVKEGGQEVRYKIDQPATAPPATTTSSLTGSSTTFGQIDVAVTALSPGSASNIGENAIKQIVLPGQEPIATDTGNFILRNAPISGGDEQPVRVVTEADVQRMLQEALTGLYGAGINQLQAQIDTRTQEIDTVSITPDAEALGKPENYEIAVEPPVGAQVPADNANFVITVKTSFDALATPRGQLVGVQLQTVLKEHFKSPCKPGENTQIDVSDYRWDGQRLAADGTITCAPIAGLAPETVSRVKRAVSGRSRAEAEQNLKALQQEGLIGGYALPPERDAFPSLDFLLRVEVQQPAQQQPTPAP